MNAKTLFTAATAVIAILGAASAMAADSPFTAARDGDVIAFGDKAGEFQGPFTSTVPRADVHAAALQALETGQVLVGDKTGAPDGSFASALTRAQVRAEAAEALRVGAISVGDREHALPTAEQLESIRMAGAKALSTTLASR